MEGGYDASSTVGNQSLETRESVQQEMPSLDQQIYHQQQQQQQQQHHQLPQNQMQIQSERPQMEIPAAKVMIDCEHITHLTIDARASRVMIANNDLNIFA